ncbi:MAG: TetR/AcrR family transcriptional regulator [Acidimicrobiales bacterium]
MATETAGLRQRKKQRTRQLIADAAARLFAERGYEQVTVVDVARAAEVAEQTVYNYFPTKEHLVLDRDEALRDRLVQLVRERPTGVSPAAAIRQEALAFVDGIRLVPADQVRGGLGYLAAVSPAIRRLSLEMIDRHATAIAAALTETTPGLDERVAKLQGIALAWVFQTITDETGRRTHDGQDPDRIARTVRPIVAAMLDDLDRWLSPSTSRRGRRPSHNR